MTQKRTYKEIAEARTKSHDKTRKKVDKQITSTADIVGVIGEGEFAKLYGLPFDEEPDKGPDPGYDFILPDGRTVNVKGTAKIDGNLIVPASERKKKVTIADVYVLAIVDIEKETADFVGWATRETVVHAPTKTWGYSYGPGYWVERKKLRPMEDLLG